MPLTHDIVLVAAAKGLAESKLLGKFFHFPSCKERARTLLWNNTHCYVSSGIRYHHKGS